MRDRLLTRGIYLAAGIAVGVLLCLWIAPAHAHPGSLARDGCHNHNAEGNRHYHQDRADQLAGGDLRGSSEIAGLCDENGPIVDSDEALWDLVNEILMRVEELESQTNFTVQDAEICDALSREYEACYNDNWCSESTLAQKRERWISTCARAPPDE